MSSHYIDSFADELGPEKIVHIYEPKSKLRAIVVIDNLSLGPAIGGVRMAPDVSTREVFRLARAMTLKNAINGLPHGGGKSAILADPKSKDKESMLRSFAQSIKHLTDYIPGPDMGTDEQCMAFVYDEIERAVGLPKVIGGLPLDELGMTGFGVAVAADVASEKISLPLKNARVIVQGFGNVGRAAARCLLQRGARVIAVSDIDGAIFNTGGIDIPVLIQMSVSGRSVAESGLGIPVARDDILDMEAEIFVPAARPDVITEINQHVLKTRLVIEGANIPITHEAAKILRDRGVMIVPDIIANGGGAICAATEYQGLSETYAFDRVKNTIAKNTEELFARIAEEKCPPHEIATWMAKERIAQAMTFRAHM